MIAAAPPIERGEAGLSAQIGIARSLCILGLVLIHVPPWHIDLGDPPRALAPFDLFFIYAQELFGRASVPLLSVISGYLLVRTTAQLAYADRLRRKVRTLIVPLLLWNGLAVLLDALALGIVPADMAGWANALLALTGAPKIQPLYFLRDMFLCAMLYPLIATALRRSVMITLTILALVTVSGVAERLFIGSGPLLFFSFGVAAAQGGLPELPAARIRPYIVVGALVMAALSTLVQVDMLERPWSLGAGQWLFAVVLMVERILGALLFWFAAGAFARGPWRTALIAIEGYVFFLFCSHVLWLALAWKAFERFGGSYDGSLYPVFFVTAPWSSLAAAIFGAETLRRFSPAVARLACGGRMPPEDGWRRIRPARFAA